jgi:hypothetical protein
MTLCRFIARSLPSVRVQVNLYDLINDEPCLKCRNKIEKNVPDEVIVNHLRAFSPDQMEVQAKLQDVDVTVLKDFLNDPHAN